MYWQGDQYGGLYNEGRKNDWPKNAGRSTSQSVDLGTGRKTGSGDRRRGAASRNLFWLWGGVRPGRRY